MRCPATVDPLARRLTLHVGDDRPRTASYMEPCRCPEAPTDRDMEPCRVSVPREGANSPLIGVVVRSATRDVAERTATVITAARGRSASSAVTVFAKQPLDPRLSSSGQVLLCARQAASTVVVSRIPEPPSCPGVVVAGGWQTGGKLQRA